MHEPHKAIFTKESGQKTITVERTYSASLDRVWQAWTDSELLDKWLGPKPWNAVTKSFDFSAGGHWHYYMAGPNGEKEWCWTDYLTITPKESFTSRNGFCDEKGVQSSELPATDWHTTFQDENKSTKVTVKLTFNSQEDMNKIIEMGFEQGFAMSLDQLETLLEIK